MIEQNYEMFKSESEEYQRKIEKLNVKISQMQKQQNSQNKVYKNPFKNNLNSTSLLNTIKSDKGSTSDYILIQESNRKQAQINKMRKSNASIQEEIENLKQYIKSVVKLNKLKDSR